MDGHPDSLDVYFEKLATEVFVKKLGAVVVTRPRKSEKDLIDDTRRVRRVTLKSDNGMIATVDFRQDGNAHVVNSVSDVTNHFNAAINRHPEKKLTWGNACCTISFVYSEHLRTHQQTN